MRAKLIEACVWLCIVAAVAMAMNGASSFDRGYECGYVDAMKQRDEIDMRNIKAEMNAARIRP